MVNYEKGLIYKLCCNDTNIKEEYVGSTVDFTERKRCHKKDCNNPNAKQYNYNVYEFIRNNGGFENWSMVLIEKYPCNDVLELKSRERHFIELLESKLNCQIPTRTQKEHYQDNKDSILEKNKVYRSKHKEQIKEWSKKHRGEHKEEIKEKKKVYYQENADDIKEKRKVYYQENADDINEKRKEKITCECGTIIRKVDLSRHYNSDKHLKYLEDRIVILHSHNSKNNEKITCECGCKITKKSLARHRQTEKHKKLLEEKK